MRLVAPVTWGFFSLGASLTRLRRELSVSIRKKYPLEPRVENVLLGLLKSSGLLKTYCRLNDS